MTTAAIVDNRVTMGGARTSMPTKKFGVFALVAAALAATPAGAADVANGQKVFRQCQACHVVDKEQNKVGPHLVGIIGRTAGSVEGFNYSPAMAGSGMVWSAETIAAYLADPKGYVNGNRMAFAGLRKPEDIADVIAYLESVGS